MTTIDLYIDRYNLRGGWIDEAEYPLSIECDSDMIVLLQLTEEYQSFTLHDFGIDTKRASKHLKSMAERGLIEISDVRCKRVSAEYLVGYKQHKSYRLLIDPYTPEALGLFRASMDFKLGYTDTPPEVTINAKDFLMLSHFDESIDLIPLYQLGKNTGRVSKHLHRLEALGLIEISQSSDLWRYGVESVHYREWDSGRGLNGYSLGKVFGYDRNNLIKRLPTKSWLERTRTSDKWIWFDGIDIEPYSLRGYVWWWQEGRDAVHAKTLHNYMNMFKT